MVRITILEKGCITFTEPNFCVFGHCGAFQPSQNGKSYVRTRIISSTYISKCFMISINYLLNKFDEVIVMEKGCITFHGEFKNMTLNLDS